MANEWSARALVVAAVVGGLPATAWAQVVETEGAEADVITSEEASGAADEVGSDDQSVDARYRVWGESLDIADFDAAKSDELTAIYQQARIDIEAASGSFGARLETDLFSGRLWGDEPPAAPPAFESSGTRASENEAFGDIGNFIDPRNAYVEYQSLFLLRVGLQTSNYGFGLVANDGVEADGELFNQKFGGDRVFRALLATRPFALFSGARALKQVTVAVGGDVVYRDDNAEFLDDDRAYQAIASVFYSDANPADPEDSRFLGFYYAFRDQEDASGDELNVSAFDVSGKTTWNDDADMWFYALGFESALIKGDTTRTFTQTGDLSTEVMGVGAAGEAEVRWKPLAMAVKLKLGYASGDANPDDDTLYRFRFDPNYHVGLVLFDQYIPAVTRTAYTRAADPSRSGAPPKGVEGLISEGAVENAVYVNPHLLFGDPDGLLTGVGFLWAQSAVPLYDPYNSFVNGGIPVGVRGAPASRDLGMEIDVAARYRHRIVDRLQIEGKVEYGILFPGDAFNDASGASAAPQNLVRGRLALLW